MPKNNHMRGQNQTPTTYLHRERDAIMRQRTTNPGKRETIVEGYVKTLSPRVTNLDILLFCKEHRMQLPEFNRLRAKAQNVCMKSGIEYNREMLNVKAKELALREVLEQLLTGEEKEKKREEGYVIKEQKEGIRNALGAMRKAKSMAEFEKLLRENSISLPKGKSAVDYILETSGWNSMTRIKETLLKSPGMVTADSAEDIIEALGIKEEIVKEALRGHLKGATIESLFTDKMEQYERHIKEDMRFLERQGFHGEIRRMTYILSGIFYDPSQYERSHKEHEEFRKENRLLMMRLASKEFRGMRDSELFRFCFCFVVNDEMKKTTFKKLGTPRKEGKIIVTPDGIYEDIHVHMPKQKRFRELPSDREFINEKLGLLQHMNLKTGETEKVLLRFMLYANTLQNFRGVIGNIESIKTLMKNIRDDRVWHGFIEGITNNPSNVFEGYKDRLYPGCSREDIIDFAISLLPTAYSRIKSEWKNA